MTFRRRSTVCDLVLKPSHRHPSCLQRASWACRCHRLLLGTSSLDLPRPSSSIFVFAWHPSTEWAPQPITHSAMQIVSISPRSRRTTGRPSSITRKCFVKRQLPPTGPVLGRPTSTVEPSLGPHHGHHGTVIVPQAVTDRPAVIAPQDGATRGALAAGTVAVHPAETTTIHIGIGRQPQQAYIRKACPVNAAQFAASS